MQVNGCSFLREHNASARDPCQESGAAAADGEYGARGDGRRRLRSRLPEVGLRARFSGRRADSSGSSDGRGRGISGGGAGAAAVVGDGWSGYCLHGGRRTGNCNHQHWLFRIAVEALAAHKKRVALALSAGLAIEATDAVAAQASNLHACVRELLPRLSLIMVHLLTCLDVHTFEYRAHQTTHPGTHLLEACGGRSGGGGGGARGGRR